MLDFYVTSLLILGLAPNRLLIVLNLLCPYKSFVVVKQKTRFVDYKAHRLKNRTFECPDIFDVFVIFSYFFNTQFYIENRSALANFTIFIRSEPFYTYLIALLVLISTEYSFTTTPQV